jgi:hypothetical protein
VGCNVINLPDGGTALVCSRGRGGAKLCTRCLRDGVKKPSRYLCDFPLPPDGRKTCDKPMCEMHRRAVRDGVDHCFDHEAKP